MSSVGESWSFPISWLLVDGRRGPMPDSRVSKAPDPAVGIPAVGATDPAVGWAEARGRGRDVTGTGGPDRPPPFLMKTRHGSRAPAMVVEFSSPARRIRRGRRRPAMGVEFLSRRMTRSRRSFPTPHLPTP
jgi:hypothetical protein